MTAAKESREDEEQEKESEDSDEEAQAMKAETEGQKEDKSDEDSSSSSSSTSSSSSDCTSEDEANTEAKKKIEKEELNLKVDEARAVAEMDAAHKLRYWDFCHGLYPELSTQDALSPDDEPIKMGEASQFHPDKIRNLIITSFVQKKRQEGKRKIKTEDTEENDQGQAKTPKRVPCDVPTRRLRSKTSGFLP